MGQRENTRRLITELSCVFLKKMLREKGEKKLLDGKRNKDLK